MKPSKRNMVPVSTFEVLIQSRSLSTFIKESVKHFRIALFTKILYAINYFHKKPHHKCLTRFLITPLKSVITNTYVYVSGVRNVRFFGKFDVLCFLETSALRFALLPYYRRIISQILFLIKQCKNVTVKNN